MTVWDDLVGQDRVQEQLGAAARDADALVTAVSGGEQVPPGSKMTHAWLFTGPPGSGRSTAARAFAAALQCTSPDRAMGGAPGCGFCDGSCESLSPLLQSDVASRRPRMPAKPSLPQPPAAAVPDRLAHSYQEAGHLLGDSVQIDGLGAGGLLPGQRQQLARQVGGLVGRILHRREQ